MKKFSLIAFFSLLGFATSSEAIIRSYWPPYVDTSECEPFKTCQRDVIDVFTKDKWKQFFVLDSGSYASDIVNGSWHHSGSMDPNITVEKIRLYLWLRLYDHNVNGNREQDGIQLQTSRGEDTIYRLKGFHDGIHATVHLCEVELVKVSQYKVIGRCKKNGRTAEKSVIWYNMDLFSGKPAMFEFSKSDGVMWGLDYIDLQMRSTTFALGLDANPSGKERTLVFPGLKLITGVQYFDTVWSQIRHVSPADIALHSRMVRLNQRKCYLKASTNNVNFQKISISPSDSNRLNPTDIPTELTLHCDGTYQENLYSGGQKMYNDEHDKNVNAKKDITISGNKAIHTVEKITISVTGNKVVRVNGQDKIGMGLDDGAGNENLYVEGSFEKNKDCGVNALPINTNILNQFGFMGFQREGGNKDPSSADPNDKFTNYSIGNRHLKTIYWKLCKQPGDLTAGTYKSNATITVEYR